MESRIIRILAWRVRRRYLCGRGLRHAYTGRGRRHGRDEVCPAHAVFLAVLVGSIAGRVQSAEAPIVEADLESGGSERRASLGFRKDEATVRLTSGWAAGGSMFISIRKELALTHGRTTSPPQTLAPDPLKRIAIQA
jgi:hypothetical protein